MIGKKKLCEKALEYHSTYPAGKLEISATKPTQTQADLALAYSPGVADPSIAIHKNPSDVWKYTNKGNLVAVISNGTAVLGLGNIGPVASKPVMEGKCVLFKKFAGLDAYDLEISSNDSDDFCRIVQSLEPGFGGINLEDIKAPECVYIEKTIQKSMNIPVMHDDQHGTAIVFCGGLINTLKLVNKKIEDIKLVVSGAGSAATSCIKLAKLLGARAENIFVCDSSGVINHKRNKLSYFKKELINKCEENTLEEVIQGADVFLGVSQGNVLTAKMLQSMTDSNPIVFALANPTPEIDYELAVNTRSDLIIATGRSDYPNQINNVMLFPFMFRAALDVKATEINEKMKLAAAYAIADLALEPITDEMLELYGLEKLEFSKDYIVPKPFDRRLLTHVTSAIAKAAMESGVATYPIDNFDSYKKELLRKVQ